MWKALSTCYENNKEGNFLSCSMTKTMFLIVSLAMNRTGLLDLNKGRVHVWGLEC